MRAADSARLGLNSMGVRPSPVDSGAGGGTPTGWAGEWSGGLRSRAGRGACGLQGLPKLLRTVRTDDKGLAAGQPQYYQARGAGAVGAIVPEARLVEVAKHAESATASIEANRVPKHVSRLVRVYATDTGERDDDAGGAAQDHQGIGPDGIRARRQRGRDDENQ